MRLHTHTEVRVFFHHHSTSNITPGSAGCEVRALFSYGAETFDISNFSRVLPIATSLQCKPRHNGNMKDLQNKSIPGKLELKETREDGVMHIFNDNKIPPMVDLRVIYGGNSNAFLKDNMAGYTIPSFAPGAYWVSESVLRAPGREF
jgi:hypothetical protein